MCKIARKNIFLAQYGGKLLTNNYTCKNLDLVTLLISCVVSPAFEYTVRWIIQLSFGSTMVNEEPPYRGCIQKFLD
jgi:hypothetical protein